MLTGRRMYYHLYKLNLSSFHPSMNWAPFSAYSKHPDWTSQGGLTGKIGKIYDFPCLVPHSFSNFSGPVIFSCFWLPIPSWLVFLPCYGHLIPKPSFTFSYGQLGEGIPKPIVILYIAGSRPFPIKIKHGSKLLNINK